MALSARCTGVLTSPKLLSEDWVWVNSSAAQVGETKRMQTVQNRAIAGIRSILRDALFIGFVSDFVAV